VNVPRLVGLREGKLAAVGERVSGLVTLLFTDLVASTELLARLGDDAAEEVRRVHFDALRQAVADAGGEEVKSLGDGLMVAFGSAVAALGCAVAMQRRVADHNRAGSGPALQVRVGLHAGEPVRDGGDFHGEAVVVAKRLCDLAAGGQIFTSELVANLVGSRGGFSFRPLGRLQLKGLPRDVAAVELRWDAEGNGREGRQGVAARPASQQPPARRGPELVGRERELAILEEEFERAATSGFGCVLLLGEPGVGKTRLAGELLARHRSDATGLSARAYQLGATTAFGVWAEALERHLRALDPDEVERLCQGAVDDLARLLRSVATLRGSRPEAEPPRSRLLDALAVLLTNLAADQPVVVLFDDVHLADASSLEALHYLGQHCAGSRMLVIATARPAELADQPMAADTLLGLEQDGLLRRLPVEPLGAEALRDLAEALTGDRAPAALVDWVGQRSKGNPLFAIGLVRALLEEGADLSAPTLRHLPEALSERVASRLRHLDPTAVALLELLAVLGRQVDSRSLVGLVEQTPDALAAILERLARASYIVEEERGLELTYELAHPLIAEAIYEGIGVGRRRRIHRQAARGLLSAGRLSEAAPHFVRSAEPGDDEAVTVLRQAVRQAEESGAYQEALTILASLVELLPAGDPRWEEVVDALSWEAQWVVDHRADNHAVLGIDALRAMDAALERLSDPARRAPVKLRLANFLAWGTGELAEAARVCGEAASLFEAAGDVRGHLLAIHELAWTRGLQGDVPALEETAREVAQRGEAVSDDVVRTRAVRTVALTTTARARFDESRAYVDEVIGTARSQRNPWRLTLGLVNDGVCLAIQGRTAEASARLLEARAIGEASPEAGLPGYETLILHLAGDFRQALISVRRAAGATSFTLSRRRGWDMAIAAIVAAEMGEPAEARRYLARASEAYGERDWGFYSQYVDYAKATLHWREGRPGEALPGLRRFTTRLAAMDVFGMALPGFVDLAELAGQLGQRDPEAVAGLAEIAARSGLEYHRGLTSLAQGWSSFGAGDRPAAAEQSATAVELLSAGDWMFYLARARYLLGLATDDRDRAVEALRSAADTFDTCGAMGRRDDALDRLARLGSRGRRVAAGARGPGALTVREAEVARLAAAGHSAREIGEQLFIGERTVEGHLARAYAKLGVGSKVELSRRAAELGLVSDR
jgi:class 3 adenylate cyclase/DNA-binding CsgD family transcriptional regulator/tetratricopeptide (TPR) repeat protein